MGDPLDSMAPFSSSQELALFPSTAGLGSQGSESSGSLRVEPTGIFLVSPPESAEANDGAPPEEAVRSSASEERGGDGLACDGKTVVDLGRDTDLGFSETEMAEQAVAELESGGAIGGCKLVRVDLPESELEEFMNWKRKLAFRARLLDEPPAKKSSSFDPHGGSAGSGVVEEKSRGKMVKSMKDLKYCSVVPRSESGGLHMKDQMLIESKGCTKVVSLDSEAMTVKNGLGSNDSTEDAGTQVVSLDSEAVMVKNGLELNDDSEAVRLVSGGRGTISEAVLAENGSGSNDSTEDVMAKMAKTGLGLKEYIEVLRLGSEKKGQGIAKDGSKSIPLTQVVILDPEHNNQVSDEDTAKPSLPHDNSTEVIVLDSDDSDDEAISEHGLGSNDPIEVVEDEGLVSNAGLPDKRPTLNYGAEKVDEGPNSRTTEISVHKGQGMGGAEKVDKAPITGTTEILMGGTEEVDKAPNTETTEISMHTGQAIGGSKNIEGTDAPSGSNSSQRPKSVRVLPITLQAKEGDSSKNTTMDLISSALRKLPKQHSDPKFENLSILEIAKQRGVTFPRPRWWKEEDDD